MKRSTLAALFVVPAFALGCGHSEDEWQAQLGRYNQVVSESAAKDRELAAARQRVGELEAELQKMGLETSKLNLSLTERDRALAEYKARAKQLELLKARFELLRRKLDELTRMGLAVSIRRNRMVISLPGDVLFDTGKDTLRKDGQDILKKVAAVIHHDKSLSDRDYQVAGHTDNQPLQGGPFHDNWGLSLMRARSVLLFLVGKGGNLPKQHWSAAGFADTDPVAGNGSKDGQQKNRRCDLIVVPDADEMLDLKMLADTGHAH
ncbi:Flagellar motor rotation protein MotB [Minicystis rosea]|nr:Flagellar motor rotation protein MotB [Minicystis rosea]